MATAAGVLDEIEPRYMPDVFMAKAGRPSRFMTITPPLPNDAQAAAQAKGRDRFEGKWPGAGIRANTRPRAGNHL